MLRQTTAIAAAALAAASLSATAHAAPNFGASGLSLDSGSSSTSTKSSNRGENQLIEWLTQRLITKIDFDAQLGGKDKSVPPTLKRSTTVEECSEQESQTAAAQSEPETEAKTSPTGPEPLYLAF